MTREVVSRREFLHSSAEAVVVGKVTLAGLVKEPAHRSGNCQLRITFSGLCYLCTPNTSPARCYALMPRAGQADAEQYGKGLELHRAALYYDMAYEDPSVPAGTAWAQYSLERWWLDVPVLGTGSPAPALPQHNFDKLQAMLRVGPVRPNMLPEYDVKKPALPPNVASHLYLREGSFDDHPAYACGTVKDKPCRIPFDVCWTSPTFNGPLQNCYMRPYLDSYNTEYPLPTLTPVGNSGIIDLYVLNGPVDEQIGWPPRPWPIGDVAATHYAAFYDLVDTTGSFGSLVGDAKDPTVPHNLAQCPDEGLLEKKLPNNRLQQHSLLGGSYTCMIAGGA